MNYLLVQQNWDTYIETKRCLFSNIKIFKLCTSCFLLDLESHFFNQKIHGCECSKAESRKREVMDDSGSDSSEEIFQEKHPMMKIPKL